MRSKEIESDFSWAKQTLQDMKVTGRYAKLMQWCMHYPKKYMEAILCFEINFTEELLLNCFAKKHGKSVQYGFYFTEISLLVDSPPGVVKKIFLLTISTRFQVEKLWKDRKMPIRGYCLIQHQIVETKVLKKIVYSI